MDDSQDFTHWWREWLGADYYRLEDFKNNPNKIKEYDILLCYFMGTGYVDLVPTFKKLNPKLKVAIQTDSDWWWMGTPWLNNYLPVKLRDEEYIGLSQSDIIINTNVKTYEWMINLGYKGSLFFSMLPVFASKMAEPIPYDNKINDKWSTIICHSFPGYDPRPNINAAKQFGLRPYLLGTFQNEKILKGFMGDNPDFSCRLGAEDYQKALSRSLINIEDIYAGCSRFTVESAYAGVPVIGTENAYSLKLLNPEFTAPNGQVFSLHDKVHRLITDKPYYESIVNNMQKIAKEHFTEEATRDRLIKHLNEYMNVDIE